MTRKRNFFRNTSDFEPIVGLQSWTRDDVGPLLSPEGRVIPFAPLLRTRKVLKYGVLHASWTLYQPHALVWDYAFWQEKEIFRQICRPNSAKIPQFCWEKCLPPPFLDNWKSFISLLQRGDGTSAKFDEVIPPRLPIFECSTFHLPFRVLDVQEVSKLSGLENHWQMTNERNANRLPDSTIRDICGNSFHPALISAALGSNECGRICSIPDMWNPYPMCIDTIWKWYLWTI